MKPCYAPSSTTHDYCMKCLRGAQTHLVLDEGHQRRDDYGDAREQKRGQLVAQALPCRRHVQGTVRQSFIPPMSRCRKHMQLHPAETAMQVNQIFRFRAVVSTLTQAIHYRCMLSHVHGQCRSTDRLPAFCYELHIAPKISSPLLLSVRCCSHSETSRQGSTFAFDQALEERKPQRKVMCPIRQLCPLPWASRDKEAALPTSSSGHEDEAVLLRHGGIDGLPLVGPEVGVPEEVLVGLPQIVGPPEGALPARVLPSIRLLAVHHLYHHAHPSSFT